MRLTIIIFSAFILVCCSNNDKDTENVPLGFSDTLLIWDTNADSMIMKKDATIPDSIITIHRVINGLNSKYPEVHIDLKNQRGDTVYIDIPNGEYLGNQMGSAGATEWFADATINLTSVPGINYVSFRMDTFSHAGSTVIGGDEYKNWKKQ